jgi:hypothetical protein
VAFGDRAAVPGWHHWGTSPIPDVSEVREAAAVETAGAITLSSQDQAAFVAVFLGGCVIVAAFVGFVIGALVGSRRMPQSSIGTGVTVALVVLVLGALGVGGVALTMVSHPGPTSMPSTGAASASSERTQVAIASPPELRQCDRAEWVGLVRSEVSAHGYVDLMRCTGTYAVADVSDRNPTNPGWRSYWRRERSGAWKLMALDREAGCGSILTADAAFPARLCDDLPVPAVDEATVVPSTTVATGVGG